MKPSIVSLGIDPQEYGQALAHAGSIEQAAVLNFMAYELRSSIRKDSDLEMQLCYISNELDSNGAQLIETLAEFIKLRRDNAPGQAVQA
jgi:hypothetical protein